MNWTPLSIYTLIPQIPKIINNGFNGVQTALNVFYDASRGILIKPINTTGKIKGATGEFANLITDNLIVKNQFSNLYDNYNTIDKAYVTAYNGSDVSTRNGTSYTSSGVWPAEPSTHKWVDVNTANIKIGNDASYGFQHSEIGTEFKLIFNNSLTSTSSFNVLLDASEGGIQQLNVTATNSAKAQIKLIMVAWDASYGPKWVVKDSAGTYTII